MGGVGARGPKALAGTTDGPGGGASEARNGPVEGDGGRAGRQLAVGDDSRYIWSTGIIVQAVGRRQVQVKGCRACREWDCGGQTSVVPSSVE